MPHLTIEYTDNLPQLEVDTLLLALNQALLDSGQFDELDIKSRAICLQAYRTGTSLQARAFVHAQLAILSGRTLETKQQLSASLLRILQRACEDAAVPQVQLSVDVQDIERASYAKALVG